MQGQKTNRGAMTDSAVERLVTPGTEAMLMRRQQSRQSPGHSDAPDSTESMYGEQFRKMGNQVENLLGQLDLSGSYSHT